MPRNYELDELKIKKESALRYEQVAFKKYVGARDHCNALYEAMESAWKKRCSAREELSQRFEEMRNSDKRDCGIWDEYERIRKENNSKIKALKKKADREHLKTCNCFDQAKAEYEYGDKSMAPVYSRKGYEHKERRDELNAEISRLAHEIKDARYDAECRTPKADSLAFYAAKDAFEYAKARHESAQTEFKCAKVEYNRLKAELDFAQKEYARLNEEFHRVSRRTKTSDNQHDCGKTPDETEAHWSECLDTGIVKKVDRIFNSSWRDRVYRWFKMRL